jgi:enterochelin esterase-like enzyme
MKRKIMVLSLLGFLLFGGCQLASSFIGSSQPIEEDTPVPSMTVTPFLPAPSNTPMPTPTPTQLPSITPTLPPAGCSDTHGVIRDDQIVTELLPKPLVYRLYLPPCYSDAKAGRYPLLILIHGQLFHVDQWTNLGATDKADELITMGSIQPFLIAMPYEENSLINPYESKFGQAIAEVLVPYLDSHYATCARRECRAIGGLSRGGAWAIHIGFTYWDEFGFIGAHSVPPFLSDPNFLPGWLKSIPDGKDPEVYMDIGETDPYRPYAVRFEAQLTQYQVPHEWHLNSGTHQEAYWSQHVEEYLRWYASHWSNMPE